MPPGAARAVVGQKAWIGRSTHTAAQVEAACGEPVTYLAIGPVFSTRSKANPDPVVGIDGVRQAAERARLAGLPVAAIGGVTLERAAAVLDAGAAAVAVLSDLLAEPLDDRVRAYLRALDR